MLLGKGARGTLVMSEKSSLDFVVAQLPCWKMKLFLDRELPC